MISIYVLGLISLLNKCLCASFHHLDEGQRESERENATPKQGARLISLFSLVFGADDILQGGVPKTTGGGI